MKLENTKKDSVDLAFEIPQAGVSILQFQEGIEKRTNEKSGKTTLQLPLVVDRVVEGPEENAGKKLFHFVPIETEFGERQLAGILTITGLIDSFAKKFGKDVDVNANEFINALKLKLPGKFIKAHHEVSKDQGGKDRASCTKFEKITNNGAAKPTVVNAAGGAAADEW